MSAKAEILAIGDELLFGQTLDTNSHWISQQLDAISIRVIRRMTIGDNRETILGALAEAESRADIICITGGLGPTSDDLTKPLLAEYFGEPLVLNEQALEEITSLFSRMGREMTELNKGQAYLPANCEKITNSMGTAPGMWFSVRNKIFISMPGVPYEMKNMMTQTILPKLEEKFTSGLLLHRIIRTIGIPESKLAATIHEWERSLPKHIKLAYLPSLGQVKLRLTGTGLFREELEQELSDITDRVIPIIEPYVYGLGQDDIEKKIGQWLLEKNQKLAIAESCTGGFLSHIVTSVAGCSRYYLGSIIAYENDVKVQRLGVKPSSIDRYGAVSEQVAKELAEGVRKELGADVGLSTTGIAGPDGGSEEKPVGTLWTGYSDKHKTVAKKVHFSKDRIINIQLGAYSALNWFRINYLPEKQNIVSLTNPKMY